MKHLFSAASCLFFLLLAASGCGDSPSPNGFCPSGVLDDNGACVAVTCADGTALDNGVCVPDENAVCGPDTVWVNGQCRSTDSVPVECGEGTSLAQDGTRCVPDVVCGPGTVAVNGECLSDSEVIVVEVDAEEDDTENDPTFGGTPQTIQLKNMGNSYLLRGQIASPQDKDGNGHLDQDVDVYEFSGQNASYVRVHVLPLGQGSFGFVIDGPQSYYRQGPRHEAAPVRSLLLPADGTYQIRVQPQASLFQADAGPVGGDEYGYLLILENVGNLDPQQAVFLDVSANDLFEGNFRNPEQNLIKLLFPSQSYIRLTLESFGASVQPALLLLDSTGKVIEQLPTDQTSFLINGAVTNSRWVYLDTVSSSGLNDTVQVRGESLSTIRFPSEVRAGEFVSSPATEVVPPLNQRFFAINVNLQTPQGMATPQGLVVEFRLSKPAYIPSLLRAYSPNAQLLGERAGNSVVFYAATSGTYLVEFVNEDDGNSLPFADVSARAHLPVDLGTINTTTNSARTASYAVSPNSETYFTFLTTEAATVSVTPSGASLPASMTLYGIDMLPRVSTQSPNLGIQRHVVASSERRVGVLRNTGSSAINGQIAVNATTAPPWETTPNNTRSTADKMSLGSAARLARIQPGEADYFEIELGQTRGLEFRVDTEGLHNLLIELLGEDGNLIERGRSTNNGFSVGAILQANQSYFLKVTNTDTKSAVYAVFADLLTLSATLEAEPNQQAFDATLVPWVSLTKTLDMAGTLVGFGDHDWFEFNLPQATWVNLEFLGLGLSPTHGGVNVTFYGADGTTQLPFEGSVRLPAGTSYVRVRAASLFLQGNTYHLRLRGTDIQPLGTLSNGDAVVRSGVFTSDALREAFSFTITQAIPLDQVVVGWSNATITVFEENGFPVHVSADAGQVFGTTRDPSFHGVGLAAGTYFLTVESDFPESWALYLGRKTLIEESELPGTNTNNSYATAEHLGELVTGTPVYRFGSVSPTDAIDYFTFTIAPSGQTTHRVVVQQFQLGESVADIDLALNDSDDIPLGNANFSPQVIDQNLEPGTYAVVSSFFDDVGFNSGAYMIRITMDP